MAITTLIKTLKVAEKSYNLLGVSAHFLGFLQNLDSYIRVKNGNRQSDNVAQNSKVFPKSL